MIFGYHTAGLLLHDEPTAIRELAAIGYRCVVLRPRRGSFNPLKAEFPLQLKQVAAAVADSGVEIILDANSRFIHDPNQPAEPSLLSLDAQQREAAASWIERLVEVTRDLGGSQLLISSGGWDAPSTDDDSVALDLLAEQLERVLEYARQRGIRLALRPSTKSFVANVAGYERLLQWLPSSSKQGGARLGLAADVGEMLASGELPLSDRLARHSDTLACVFLCDMITGTPGDQRLGHGDVNLGRIRDSLATQEFLGAAIVRIEGYEQLGMEVAREAFAYLGK